VERALDSQQLWEREAAVLALRAAGGAGGRGADAPRAAADRARLGAAPPAAAASAAALAAALATLPRPSDRQRLQASVFRPSHILPSMSVEQFGEQERARMEEAGRAQAAREAERAAARAELGSDEEEEERVVKARSWDDWKARARGRGGAGAARGELTPRPRRTTIRSGAETASCGRAAESFRIHEGAAAREWRSAVLSGPSGGEVTWHAAAASDTTPPSRHAPVAALLVAALAHRPCPDARLLWRRGRAGGRLDRRRLCGSYGHSLCSGRGWARWRRRVHSPALASKCDLHAAGVWERQLGGLGVSLLAPHPFRDRAA